jgi:hypothetical protein
VVKTNKMKIIKTNGKTASKKIHLLADVVMETSVTSAWMMSEEMKKDLILNSDEFDMNPKSLDDMCNVCLNHNVALHFALYTWFTGYYGDFDLDYDSVEDYFIHWGS